MNQGIHRIQSGSVSFVRKRREPSGTLKEVRPPRTALSVSLRPHDAGAIGRKRMAGILELLHSGMGTIVIDLRKSGV